MWHLFWPFHQLRLLFERPVRVVKIHPNFWGKKIFVEK